MIRSAHDSDRYIYSKNGRRALQDKREHTRIFVLIARHEPKWLRLRLECRAATAARRNKQNNLCHRNTRNKHWFYNVCHRNKQETHWCYNVCYRNKQKSTGFISSAITRITKNIGFIAFAIAINKNKQWC